MSIKTTLDQDIKSAMLAGDKQTVITLRGLKSAILYAEVAKGQRESGMSDEEVVQILMKESKKRQESADLFRQGGNIQKAEAEELEKKIIEEYLPAQMGEAEILEIVERAIDTIGDTRQDMGKIIGMVRQQTGAAADGALIAKLVKERLK